MYLKHFALTRAPFTKTLSTLEMFSSAGGLELEARLQHLLQLHGTGLFTGEPGCGKTSVTRKVLGQLHPGQHKVLYIPNSTGNIPDMYKSIAWELGLNPERSRAGLYRSIQTEVSRLCVEGRVRPVLVIDEAHLLRSDVLEELRLLTNYELDSQDRLCLIFLGQSELRRRISMSALEALNQRITVRFQLPALAREETGAYLKHLLRLAGTELPLFEVAAVEAIHQASGGLPRRISSLAHHSLNAAAMEKARVVTTDHVLVACAETE